MTLRHHPPSSPRTLTRTLTHILVLALALALVLATKPTAAHLDSECNEATGHCICTNGKKCVGSVCTQISRSRSESEHHTSLAITAAAAAAAAAGREFPHLLSLTTPPPATTASTTTAGGGAGAGLESAFSPAAAPAATPLPPIDELQPLVSGFSKHLCPDCECKTAPRWHTPEESRGVCVAFPYHCSPHGWAWLDGDRPIIDKERACARLAAAGMRRFLFAGDSFIRHTFEAFALTLSGDYEFGAIKSSERKAHPECKDNGQFAEKVCRNLVQPRHTNLCGGRVELVELKYGAWVGLANSFTDYDIVIWAGGAHPVDEDYKKRLGVYNATIVSQYYFEKPCVNQNTRLKFLPQQPNIKPGGEKSAPKRAQNPRNTRVWWLSQHSRLNFHGKYYDEAEEGIRTYNRETKSLLASMCNIQTIDVYTFTAELVHGLPVEASTMTWDQVHWSRAVNLIKVQIILYTITGG